MAMPSELTCPTESVWSRIQGDGESDFFLIEHRTDYLSTATVVTLVVALVREPSGAIALVVSDRVSGAREWLAGKQLSGETLLQLAAYLASPVIRLNDAVRLAPVHIAKPWGQEIWYTGIEARGQSLVSDGRFQMPLPWLLALGRENLLEVSGAELNLLKILDPLGEEVFGDLYFELHEQKREVYVVTGIDLNAWPSGKGAIRYGFDQRKRLESGDDQQFRQDYLAAVRQYEKIRRDIDKLLDAFRRQNGIGLNDPVEVATMKQWLQTLPRELLERERAARECMNSFTHLLPLSLGDVVKVPCLMPHALQHGVRTVEFQTPVYERKILNFAQKVLTQDHWDTEEAVAQMDLGSDMPGALKVLRSTELMHLEQVVAFDDFEALRLTLKPGGRFPLSEGDHYKIVMAIEGELEVGSERLEPEGAVLVPRTATACSIENRSSSTAVCLLSLPVVTPP